MAARDGSRDEWLKECEGRGQLREPLGDSFVVGFAVEFHRHDPTVAIEEHEGLAVPFGFQEAPLCRRAALHHDEVEEVVGVGAVQLPEDLTQAVPGRLGDSQRVLDGRQLLELVSHERQSLLDVLVLDHCDQIDVRVAVGAVRGVAAT